MVSTVGLRAGTGQQKFRRTELPSTTRLQLGPVSAWSSPSVQGEYRTWWFTRSQWKILEHVGGGDRHVWIRTGQQVLHGARGHTRLQGRVVVETGGGGARKAW